MKKVTGGGGWGGEARQLELGLYAPYFTRRESARVRRMSAFEALPEIHILRVQLARILARLDACEDEERMLKLYGVFFTCMQRLLTAIHDQSAALSGDRQALTEFWKGLSAYQEEAGLQAPG